MNWHHIGFCLIKLLYIVAWWLITSALLMATWNKVVCHLSKLKKVKFKMALLFVATLGFLFYGPKYMLYKSKSYHHKASYCPSKTHQGYICPKKSWGDCPYSKKKGQQSKSAEQQIK